MVIFRNRKVKKCVCVDHIERKQEAQRCCNQWTLAVCYKSVCSTYEIKTRKYDYKLSIYNRIFQRSMQAVQEKIFVRWFPKSLIDILSGTNGTCTRALA